MQGKEGIHVAGNRHKHGNLSRLRGSIQLECLSQRTVANGIPAVGHHDLAHQSLSRVRTACTGCREMAGCAESQPEKHIAEHLRQVSEG